MADNELWFNGVSSATYGAVIMVERLPGLPELRKEDVYAIGRDAPYTYIDGYNNQQIEVTFNLPGGSLSTRLANMRLILGWLQSNNQWRELIFGFELNITYKARVVDNFDFDLSLNLESFKVIFETLPIKYESNFIWDRANIKWDDMDIPWLGDNQTFEPADNTHFNLVNSGAYKVKPLLKLTCNVNESASNWISMMWYNTNGSARAFRFEDFTYNMSTYYYIDNDNYLVYQAPSINSANKWNKMLQYTHILLEEIPGDFMTLPANSTTSIFFEGHVNGMNITAGQVTLEFVIPKTYI
jgi:phage-related protein